ncbi:CDK5 and ABL1 enzyme substrate 1 [Pyrgilauda ruficollis]|uniref:CDK5 and ABL1 enzyme substrate 1 n=1 Tax=Pyrgilauda ruficollis TaxID=221976 RepID=UPI001B88335E|nr:CDK5 and ABL1 enzyme substrate 1 [Pyrgilauda ruficollis]
MLLAHTEALARLRLQQGPGTAQVCRIAEGTVGIQAHPRGPLPDPDCPPCPSGTASACSGRQPPPGKTSGQRQGRLARHGCIPVPLPALFPVPQTGRAQPQPRVRSGRCRAPRAMCRIRSGRAAGARGSAARPGGAHPSAPPCTPQGPRRPCPAARPPDGPAATGSARPAARGGGAGRQWRRPPPPPALAVPPPGPCREEDEEEEEDAFAAVQVPPAVFLGAAAAGSRCRLNSFTAGVLPAPFGRTSPQGSIGGSGDLGQPGPAAAFELQRSRRRLISQRSSLETLEDIEENAPLRRCRTLSGSPRPKNFKKVHFIKNMRQHDTRNGRIVLISSRRSFCSIFSVLPYRDCTQVGDMKLDGGRQCHSAGVCLKEIIGLEGVELGADGKTVSYTQFLYPTNALGTRRNTIDSTSSFSQFRNASHRSLSLGRANSTQGSIDAGSDLGDFVEYDPNLLDDPQWPCGKHKRVLIFPSYMTTVIDYVKPSDLKKDMNETFKEKFPHIKLTLSKIRSLKREMRKLAQEECGFEEPTVAMAFVYFEKLALKGKLNKQNRKLCAGACVLLAAKIGSDLRKHEVKHLIDKLEEKFRLNRRELIAFEFPVLVALEFALHLPEHEVMPHYRRLVQNS